MTWFPGLRATAFLMAALLLSLAGMACAPRASTTSPAAPVTSLDPPAGAVSTSAPPTATPTVGTPIPSQVIARSPVAGSTVAAGGSPAAAATSARPPASPAVPVPASPAPAAASPPVAAAPAGPPPAGQRAPSATAPATPTPIPPTPTPWLPQVRDVGEMRIALTQLDQGVTPDGRPVARLRVELTNRSDRAGFFADVYFKLVVADGQRLDPVTDVDSPDRMHQGPLSAGQSTAGYLWYLLPPSARVTAIFYDGPTGQTTIPVPGA